MLEEKFLDKKLKNPTVLASGIMGLTGESLCLAAKNGAGVVTTKSISLAERFGHKNPTVAVLPHAFLNCIGLSNPGLEFALKEIEYAKKNCPVPVIASVFADSVENFAKIAGEISRVKPDFIEVNISCPNVESEFGKPFASDAQLSAQITAAVKDATKIPVIVKLSPNVASIVEIGLAVEEAGADALTAINCVGPGMIIDLEAGKPVLSNKVGGLSGAAIKPITLKSVFQLYEKVKIPLIGLGGVTSGRDALEMIMAGAALVGIGSGVAERGLDVFDKVCLEMTEWMEARGYKSLKELRGKAHD